MITRGSGEIDWTSYDLPSKIDDLSDSSYTEFWYGPDRSRIQQYQSSTGATITYAGLLFEFEDAATDTYRHYVQAGDKVIAVVERVNTTNTKQFLHRDHQGSVTKVTNASGTVDQALAFDAWGLRRNAADWSALGSPFAGSHEIERGYTGHEHLDPVGLIHMNGRVQDPILGRFISADPLIQSPYSTQSHNRGWMQEMSGLMAALERAAQEMVGAYAPRSTSGGAQGGVPNSGPFMGQPRTGGGNPFAGQQRGGAPQPQNQGQTSQSQPGDQWPVPGFRGLNQPDRPREGDPNYCRGSASCPRIHDGIDIQAPVGTPVVAWRNGVVAPIRPNPSSSYGTQVVIEHSGGIYSVYVARTRNCYIDETRNYIDCEYIDSDGISYVVEGTRIVRKEVRLSESSIGRLPMGIERTDTIQDVIGRIVEQFPSSLVWVLGRSEEGTVVLTTDLAVRSAAGTLYEFFLEFAE